MTVHIKSLKPDAPIKQIKQGMSFMVLVRLHDLLDFHAFRQIRMQSIADDIGAGGVSRAMKDLVRLGILEREGAGPRVFWRFSSKYGWDDAPGAPCVCRSRTAGRQRPKGDANPSGGRLAGPDA